MISSTYELPGSLIVAWMAAHPGPILGAGGPNWNTRPLEVGWTVGHLEGGPKILCTYMYVYITLHIHRCGCTFVRVFVFVVCVCIHMYTYTHTYTYTYTYT